MILTGMLIYVPPAERAGVAALVCMIAIANLNYFRPHKNTLLFWLSQLSFVITTCKYITALVLSVAQHEAGEAGAGGGAGAEAQRRRVDADHHLPAPRASSHHSLHLFLHVCVRESCVVGWVVGCVGEQSASSPAPPTYTSSECGGATASAESAGDAVRCAGMVIAVMALPHRPAIRE